VWILGAQERCQTSLYFVVGAAPTSKPALYVLTFSAFAMKPYLPTLHVLTILICMGSHLLVLHVPTLARFSRSLAIDVLALSLSLSLSIWDLENRLHGSVHP
jgi:hypothetical protein